MSVKDVGYGQTVWNATVKKTSPAVPPPAEVENTGAKPGSDDPSREQQEFSDRKRLEHGGTYKPPVKGKIEIESSDDNLGNYIDLDQ